MFLFSQKYHKWVCNNSSLTHQYHTLWSLDLLLPNEVFFLFVSISLFVYISPDVSKVWQSFNTDNNRVFYVIKIIIWDPTEDEQTMSNKHLKKKKVFFPLIQTNLKNIFVVHYIISLSLLSEFFQNESASSRELSMDQLAYYIISS